MISQYQVREGECFHKSATSEQETQSPTRFTAELGDERPRDMEVLQDLCLDSKHLYGT